MALLQGSALATHLGTNQHWGVTFSFEISPSGRAFVSGGVLEADEKTLLPLGVYSLIGPDAPYTVENFGTGWRILWNPEQHLAAS